MASIQDGSIRDIKGYMLICIQHRGMGQSKRQHHDGHCSILSYAYKHSFD